MWWAFSKTRRMAFGHSKRLNTPDIFWVRQVLTSLIGNPVLDGVYVPAPLIYSRHFLFAREVKEKYDGLYGKPLTHQAASGYDVVKLLAGLLEGREVTRKGLRELLAAGFIYPGIFGEIELKPGKRDIIIPLHPARIVEGKIEFLR